MIARKLILGKSPEVLNALVSKERIIHGDIALLTGIFTAKLENNLQRWIRKDSTLEEVLGLPDYYVQTRFKSALGIPA